MNGPSTGAPLAVGIVATAAAQCRRLEDTPVPDPSRLSTLAGPSNTTVSAASGAQVEGAACAGTRPAAAGVAAIGGQTASELDGYIVGLQLEGKIVGVVGVAVVVRDERQRRVIGDRHKIKRVWAGVQRRVGVQRHPPRRSQCQVHHSEEDTLNVEG